MIRVLLLALPLSHLATLPLQGQQRAPSRYCFVEIDYAGRANQQTYSGGVVYYFVGDSFKAHCRDGFTTMESDSVEWYSNRGELRLIGNVHFRDSTAILDADRVTYWTRQERLYAVGNVYTRNLETGTELRGPNMDYYRAVPQIRDTLEVIATQRPTINFRPRNSGARDTLRADSTQPPFVIVADRVRMLHTNRMWGAGRVTINRVDLDARADSAQLNLADSVGYLVGNPMVVGRDTTRPAGDTTAAYRLTGNLIRFDLDSRQDVKRVLSSGLAEAVGPQWRLISDTLDMTIDSGQIQRAQAWGTMRRAFAESGLNTITADSLDIQMPKQVMRQVWAYGDARALSKPDTTQAEDDWMSGDSLRANFAPPPDTGRVRRSVIEQVIAFGTARAFYHTENQNQRGGEPGINYSRGDRIQIAMRDGKVNTVDIVGQVDGIYLEPVPFDSARADSLRRDSLRADSARGRRPGIGNRDAGIGSGQPGSNPDSRFPTPDSRLFVDSRVYRP